MVTAITQKYKLTSRAFRPKTHVSNGDVTSAATAAIMAGPCSVESREQLLETALSVKVAGLHFYAAARTNRAVHLRFSGMGEAGLKLLARSPRGHRPAIITRSCLQQSGPGGRLRRRAANWRAPTCKIFDLLTPWRASTSQCCSAGACPPPLKTCLMPRIHFGARQQPGQCSANAHSHFRHQICRNTFDITPFPCQRVGLTAHLADPSHAIACAVT